MKTKPNVVNRLTSTLIAGLASVSLVLPTTPALGFGIGLGKVGKPVHELLTHDAVDGSGIVSGPLFQPLIERMVQEFGPKMIEKGDATDLDHVKRIFEEKAMMYVLEGVRFNDDPDGYFMTGAENHYESFKLPQFLANFLGNTDKPKHRDATETSHFGSYQFLHAMGMKNEPRAEVKRKIMKYMEHVWKLATEPDSLINFWNQYNDLEGRFAELKKFKSQESKRLEAARKKGENNLSDEQIKERAREYADENVKKLYPLSQAQELFWDAASRFDKNILFFHVLGSVAFNYGEGFDKLTDEKKKEIELMHIQTYIPHFDAVNLASYNHRNFRRL